MEDTFVATAAEVHACLGFEADCTVGSIDAASAPSRIVRCVRLGDQVIKIGADDVSDRCEFRTILSNVAHDVPLTFTVRRSNEKPPELNDADRVDAGDARPQLTQFNNAAGGAVDSERTFRVALASAINKVSKGRCIIGVGDAQFNPSEEVKILAEELGLKAPVVIDLGVRLKNRIAKEAFARQFEEAMTVGTWFVVTRSTKSMSLLTLLAALVDEMHANGLRGVHDNARIIISAEPHPHFPPSLTHKSKTLRIKTSFSQSSIMYESIGNSVSALRLASDQVSLQDRKVRMSSAVSVVEIESREVIKAEKAAAPRPQVNVAGTVQLRNTFTALPHDKFFGICYASDDKSRIALASSLGNVYLVDDSGSSLVSFHVHDAAVWDVSFSSQYDFVTGGEDQSAVMWSRDAEEKDTLVCRQVVKCANDVYALRHTQSKRAVAIGGLMPKLTILGCLTGQVDHVPLSTSLQAICPFAEDSVVSGGGDGSVFVVDTDACKVVATATQHTKKCPCITAAGNLVVSGSFDCTVRLWDTRASGQQSLHTLKFQHYVTGLSTENNILAACVGDNLYLWDTRNLSNVLGGQPHAWTGLSRAMCLDAESKAIVTASPDGIARFWSFAAE